MADHKLHQQIYSHLRLRAPPRTLLLPLPRPALPRSRLSVVDRLLLRLSLPRFGVVEVRDDRPLKCLPQFCRTHDLSHPVCGKRVCVCVRLNLCVWTRVGQVCVDHTNSPVGRTYRTLWTLF